MEPYLCQVKGVVWAGKRLFFRHNLYIKCPARKISPLYAFIEIPLVAFPVTRDNRFSLMITQVFYPLLTRQVKLDPVPLFRCIDKAVGMAAETVHMPVGSGDAPVAHYNGNLMKRLG